MQKDAEDFAKEIVSDPDLSGPVERFLSRQAITTAFSAAFVAAVIIGVAFFGMTFFGMTFDEPTHVHLAAIAAAVALCIVQDLVRNRSLMRNLRQLAADLSAGDGGFLARTRFDMSRPSSRPPSPNLACLPASGSPWVGGTRDAEGRISPVASRRRTDQVPSHDPDCRPGILMISC